MDKPIAFVAFGAILTLTACSHDRLSSTECNSLVNSWNGFLRQVSDYDNNISYFREPIAATSPVPKGAGYLMVAHVPPDNVNHVLDSPSISVDSFRPFPRVQLKLQDVQTDLSLFSRAVKSTEMSDASGNWGTTTPSPYGVVYDLLDLTVKPGTSGPAAFDELFGKDLQRRDADYADALAAMREAYQANCGGDVSEIRSLEDFK